jgi:hypothetical protein
VCIWCRLQSKSIYSHVSTSCELQTGHVFEGNLCIPKINCVMAFPMYWLFLNFSKFVFCESVNSRLFQKSLDIFFIYDGVHGPFADVGEVFCQYL